MSIEEITFEPTHQCNLRCVHCSSHYADGELSFEKIKEIVAKYKPNVIRWSGGEPGMYLTIDHVTFPGKHIISTNGTFRNVLDWVNYAAYRVSIYGLARPHDGITGVKGSFDKAYGLITELKEMKADVAITSPFWNAEQLLEVIDIANELGVDARITALVPHTMYSTGNTCSTGSGICEIDKKLLVLPDGKMLRCASEKRGTCPYNKHIIELKQRFMRDYGHIYEQMAIKARS